MKKIVYIIGAGFSKDLNAPLQSDLIKEIFEFDPKLLVGKEKQIFIDFRTEFSNYLENVLYISPDKFSIATLEDIYTPIDRCIIDNISFRNLSKKDLLEFRQKINALLIILIRYKLRDIPNDNYAQKFSKYLVDIKRGKSIDSDPFSLLSLNWDIIMDNALNNEITNSEGVVDYCCHITPYKSGENIMPGLLARGKGLFNVKLLKLHGSMNWLQCQRCQRLFITFDEKIAVEEYLTEPECRLCKRNFSNNSSTQDGSALLTSQLIMPTFLKDLNNVQLKLIWHNAGIELAEASKIVFIGYSFPAADFELRQLLSRSVRHKAKIEVVLRKKSPDIDKDCPELRYRTFFGKREVKIIYGGVENYIVVPEKGTLS